MWPFWRHDATNIGILLGFYWQMTHVEATIDVVHVQNIER